MYENIYTWLSKLSLSNTAVRYSTHSSNVSEVRWMKRKKFMTVFIIIMKSKISKKVLAAECCNIHTDSEIHS